MTTKKKVFVFVSGQTPQIITETIYVLACQTPSIYADKIILITTSEGANIAKQSLIKNGILKKLCLEYHLPYVKPQFEVPFDDNGCPLPDIRTKEDNTIMANFINKIIKGLTKDENTELHCSIAGGRKTMSFYLGSALQLYGRSQDKLYHVLVSSEFETNRDFFYKPKINQQIKSNNGKILNTNDAQIELAELPFLRIGEKIRIEGKGFEESIKYGQEAINDAVFDENVTINFKERELRIGERKINLQPIHLTIYATLLKLKKNCKEKNCEICETCCISRNKWDQDKINIFNKYYKAARGEGIDSWFSGRKKYDPVVLTSAISKINNIIKKIINNDIFAQNYLIKSYRRYGETNYGLSIKPDKIII